MLTLYKNITPNYKSTYYYFKVLSKFLSFLSSYKHDEIEAKNYTIVRGSIRVKMDDTKATKLSNYKNVTYIYDDTSECFYHVNNAIVESGYVFFTTSLDNFATYFYKAKLSNINVRKCNRKISNSGYYNEIEKTNLFEIEDIGGQIEGNVVDIVILISYDGGSDLIAQSVANINTDLGQVQGFYVILEWLSGIYKIKHNTWNGEKDAKIERIYIIPHELLDYDYTKNTAWEVKGKVLRAHEDKVVHFYSGLFVRPYKRKDITLQLTNINKKYYIGGVNGHISLLNYTTPTREISYICYGSNNELKVVVTDGNNQQDITASFSFSASTGTRQESATEGISSAIRYMTSIAQLGIGVATGSPLSVVRGLGGIGRNIVQDLEPKYKEPSHVIGAGDGIVNMKIIAGSIQYFYSGYKLISATSIIDEQKRARKTGANFNEYIEKLSDVFTFELLGSGSANDDTFLQATLDIDGIPTTAIEDIEGLLAGGINLQYIQ